MKELSKKVVNISESSTLGITAKAKEMRENGIDVISFSVGEPDFQTPQHICSAAIESITQGFTKYTPASGTVELRKAIANKLNVENDLAYDFNQIIVSNGAKHSLFNIFTALLNDGDEVIIPAPFWLSYAQMVKIAGGVPVIIYTKKEDGFKVTKNQLEAHLTEKTKLIVINSPCNPTGVVYDKKDLEIIADFAVSNDLYVISDEIYEKLIFDVNLKHISIASLNTEIFEKTIVVNGFSKAYAMTGWRIGYTASSLEIAKVMGNIQSHCYSNPNSIAQKAAYKALTSSNEPTEKMVYEFKERRNYIYERVLSVSQISAVKPNGAFYIFIDISNLCGVNINGKNIENANDLALLLLDEVNVAVVPGKDFGFPKHIRLSYSMSMDNIREGMDRIESFIKKHYDKF